MKIYILMHKDEECGLLSIDEITGRFSNYKDNGLGFSPYLGNADLYKMKKWWEMRAIPANRETIKELINSLEVVTNEEYLAKNLALSVTDTYWIRPLESNISYKDINFFNFKNYNDGKIPYHNSTSYDPNAALSGQMDKYWDLSKSVPTLIKKAYKSFGQQAVNELFATMIHKQQRTFFPYTEYSIVKKDDGSIHSLCNAFTNENVEFVSAYEVLESEKINNDINYYNAYIDICSRHGIDKDYMQYCMDYQTLTDFVISNTDEHLMNFGILRNADTLEFVSAAPIFDSGNSMFYDDLLDRPFSRVEILNRKVSTFYEKEEKILKNIKYKNAVDISLLPTPKEAYNFYKDNSIPEHRAEIISKNYETKLLLLEEFQHGKTISLYNERKRL